MARCPKEYYWHVAKLSELRIEHCGAFLINSNYAPKFWEQCRLWMALLNRHVTYTIASFLLTTSTMNTLSSCQHIAMLSLVCCSSLWSSGFISNDGDVKVQQTNSFYTSVFILVTLDADVHGGM